MSHAVAAPRRFPGALLMGARSILASLSGSAGDRRTVLTYGVFTVVVFVIALLATFPHDLLLQRALRQATSGSAVVVETEGASLGWTFAYGIDAIRVRLRAADGDPILLAEHVRLAPSLLGLVRGSPYPLGIGASLYGGTLRGTVDPRPARFRIDATLTDVDLARYTGLRPLVEGALRGRIQGTLAVDGAGRGPAAAAGTVELRLPGLALEDVKIRGITVPNLHFGDVHVTGTLKNGRLDIGELVAAGDELSVRGDGHALLRAPLESSVLNLDLTVTPAASAPDGLKMAVNLLPGSNGEGGGRRISVGGTLGRPSLQR